MYAARQFFYPDRANSLDLCCKFVRGRQGIEIGGPSGVFSSRGVLPLYEEVDSLDNCNFSSQTTWEGSIREGGTFIFSTNRPPGMQYVAETTNLKCIADENYNFLLSSHVLEHSANALKVLYEWIRIIKPGGMLVLLLPHKDGTFDHHRPVTSLEHLIEDYEVDTKEDDLTHLPEILSLHDLYRDPAAGTKEEFERRSRANFENRCLHHHVFDTTLVARLIDYVGLELLAVETMRPNHVITIARKPCGNERPDNRTVLAAVATQLRRSPFPSDRQAMNGIPVLGTDA